MTILVSVPYWNCPDLVGKCVRSILAQTHRDLVCVVIGDGEEPPLANVTDSRLVVYNLPENRGAYFAQSVALGASPHEWYAPVGADDWLDPDHIERLLEYGTDVAAGAVWQHNGGARRIVRKQFEVGVYRTERLRAMGGYNSAERLGQDSLMLRLLRVTGGVAASTHPTYHRVQREGSLCNHPDSKRGSPAREAMRLRNRAVAAVCEGLGSTQAIRAYRESIVPPKIREQVAAHAERLRGILQCHASSSSMEAPIPQAVGSA